MSDVVALSTEELAAELAARQAAAEAALEEQQRHRRDAVLAWDRGFVEQFRSLEERLIAEGEAFRDAFAAAVRAGDLAGVFAAWIAERSGRYAREALRTQLQQSSAAIGEPTRLPDLTWRHPDLLRRLEEEADRAARVIGYDTAGELTGDRPV